MLIKIKVLEKGAKIYTHDKVQNNVAQNSSYNSPSNILLWIYD